MCSAQHIYVAPKLCAWTQNGRCTLCFCGAAIEKLLEYAGHVWLCLHNMENAKNMFLECCHSEAARVCKACESAPTLCEGACGASIHQVVSGPSVASGNNPCVTVDKQCLSSYSKPATALSHLIGGDSL